VRETWWPTDRQPLRRWQHVADYLTDTALGAFFGLTPCLLIAYEYFGALVCAAVSITTWRVCRRDARP